MTKKRRKRLSEPEKTEAVPSAGKKCTYCKHVYMQPCMGADQRCRNKIHVDCKGKFDPYQLTSDQLEKIVKTGKLPNPSEVKKAAPVPKPKSKVKKRVKLSEVAKPATKSKKRKRVRLS